MRGLLPQLEAGMFGVLSTPLMLALFILLVCWVFSRRRRDVYRRIERLPLDDDQSEGVVQEFYREN